MEILFGIFLSILFLYFNAKIVYIDKISQKIPNKYLGFLLLLLPFWYIYNFFFGTFGGIDIYIFILQIFITLIVGFGIYAANIWGAGDAKYLCVLGLFIPHIGVLNFIGNIGVITLVYLLVYFLFFWFGKNLWIKKRRSDFYKNIWIIKKNQFIHNHWKKNTREIIFALLKSLNIFLLAFLALRFFRFFLFLYLGDNFDLIEVFQQYGMYIIIASIAFTFALIITIKNIYNLMKKYIFRTKDDEIYFLCILSILGMGLLLYGYFLHPKYFSEKIILIFTLYLGLYLLFKFLWEMCQITFKMQEQPLIHVDDIKEGMIIDKKWFDLILARDRDVFGNIGISGSMLTKEDVETVKKVIYKINEIEKQPYIPIYKTFGFALCIFGGFIATYIFDSLIIRIIVGIYKSLFL